MLVALFESCVCFGCVEVYLLDTEAITTQWKSSSPHPIKNTTTHIPAVCVFALNKHISFFIHAIHLNCKKTKCSCRFPFNFRIGFFVMFWFSLSLHRYSITLWNSNKLPYCWLHVARFAVALALCYKLILTLLNMYSCFDICIILVCRAH